jgi:hypothetical protein
MSRLLAQLRLSLLALPLSALAEPVTVTTRSSGFVDPIPGAVYHLGIDLYDVGTGPLPYSLTLSSTFDPEHDGFLEGEGGYWTPDAAVAMQLQIGTQRYRYNGSATTRVQVFGATGYEQEIGLIPDGIPRWVTFISSSVDGPVGSGGPFAPRTLALGPGQGSMRISTFLDDPDAPSLSWEMRGEAAAVSLQVVSGVPEPAPAHALLAALATLGLWRWRRTADRRRVIHQTAAPT